MARDEPDVLAQHGNGIVSILFHLAKRLGARARSRDIEELAPVHGGTAEGAKGPWDGG